ncbi:Protein OSCP1 [Halotydeus destructor]|nr:Protein OSCP1 [Halotydeus destructor]
MRLSGESYDKLFDLMVGVFKYQVSLVPFPASIHFVTWNHFKSILELDNVLSKDTWTGMKNMADAYMSTFEQLTRSEWAELRNVLLNSFFGDIRTRVSILLREGCQDMESGHYVIPSIGSDTYGVSEKFEGRIVHYNDDGSVGEEFGHFEPGDEGTNLGFDIYASELDEKPSKCEGYNCLSNKNSTGEHETRLLASLLGRSESLTEHFNIEFDFQDGDHESNSSSSKQPLDLVKSKQLMSTLHTPKVFDEDQHSPANEDDGNDFLLLMDS